MVRGSIERERERERERDSIDINDTITGLEAVLLLLCYKAKYKDNFYMLRGNHECTAINRIYGFCDECEPREMSMINAYLR
jgi:hypothetical protein